MKRSILFLATIAATTAFAAPPPGCYMQSATLGKTAGSLSEVADVKQWVTPVKDKTKKCIVTFRGRAKDRWQSGTGEYVFPTSMSDDAACDMALNNGKLALAEEIFGKTIVKAEQLVCSDFPTEENKATVKIGEVIALSQVRPHPTKREPFGHNGAECRYFVETDLTNDFYMYNGIICSTGNEKWRVVDKW